jgi:hypothetical protein
MDHARRIAVGASGLLSWLLLASGPGPACGQAPRVGQVQRLTVITLSMQVGSTEKETRRVTYTPPPGWYVRGHRVDCARRLGNSSFTVNTVPRDWTFVSEEKINESYKALIDLAGQAHNAGLKAKFALEQEQLLSELRKVRSTHHALVVEATARGEGFLRGGGALQLTITADLVYVGTDESLSRAVARHRSKLKPAGTK